jgi:hypothetical protein
MESEQMHGDFVLIEMSGKVEKAQRVFIGEVKDKNEAWLRDTLFNNPEIIPIDDVDTAFGPLIPLCTELRTDAGPIDAVFINEQGRLTIVECKLWKNPQARREVVAQTLHYVSALARWSYADLQRQVSAALGKRGNIPFELVRERTSTKIGERNFVDAVSRSLREGRILVIIAGDGIREGVQSLTDLVNRSATKAFSLGLVEVALYQLGNDRLIVQPRILAETETIERRMTVVNMNGATSPFVVEDIAEEETSEERTSSGNKEHLRMWWRPILQMRFDDPEQEPPFWTQTNNIVLNTPFPGIRIKAYAVVDGSRRIGVFVSGTRRENVLMIQKYLRRERVFLQKQLPEGTVIKVGDDWPIVAYISDLETDDQRRAWIIKTLNEFVNVLSPFLRKWYAEARPET